ncbi:MAG: nitroreductase family protein [Candidatus Bathyarchaeia archaeon]
MDVFEALTKRKSVRSYLETPVPDEVLAKVMEAARLAPSAGNVQPWHFIAVRKEEKRVRIAKGCRYGKFLDESPVVIIACGDKKASPHYYAMETAIALEHVVIASTALGLGTCWIGMFKEQEIREMLNLPENFEIIALLALGYPREKVDIWARILHAIRPRKRLEEILSLETYGEKPEWSSQ